MDRLITCTPRRLPPRLRVKAAVHAVDMYAANLPAGISIDDLTSGDRSGDDDAARLSIMVDKWWGGSVDLTVGFLDGPSRELRDRILLHMNAWGRDAAVRFHEADTDPVVRVARLTENDAPGFGGFWSYEGTDVSLIPGDEPTLNLEGFTMRTPESEFHRVVRHEAGHTLGFPHEHLRGALIARLDPEKVIAAYMRSQGWSEQEVVDQILTPLEESSIFGTTITDQTSIMCYQIDGDLTLDGTPILGGLDINELDHSFAAQVYPRL
ncbi:hypothetical protein [Actinoplanes sp. G11-F43]|uniref:hypothetical protein n=1 Tax=Actinoplanes sp. G11-F43 TaxID=3424130 RepID=UPI003D35179C